LPWKRTVVFEDNVATQRLRASQSVDTTSICSRLDVGMFDDTAYPDYSIRPDSGRNQITFEAATTRSYGNGWMRSSYAERNQRD
jgi:hypothetical protein